MKFDDLNANGAKDAGEPGLRRLDRSTRIVDVNGNGDADAGENDDRRDATRRTRPASTRSSLNPGKYVVCEVQQATWTQSFPAGTACGASAGGWGITLDSGELDSGNDFGNYRQATKTGIKFNDLNGDGVKDAGEPGLPGWIDQRVRRHERQRHPRRGRDHDLRDGHDQRERRLHADASRPGKLRGVRGAAGDVDPVLPGERGLRRGRRRLGHHADLRPARLRQRLRQLPAGDQDRA